MSTAVGAEGELASSIKSEGYNSQLAPAGLDCHLAQINRELSGLFENIGILRGILRIFFWQYCLLLPKSKILPNTPSRLRLPLGSNKSGTVGTLRILGNIKNIFWKRLFIFAKAKILPSTPSRLRLPLGSNKSGNVSNSTENQILPLEILRWVWKISLLVFIVVNGKKIQEYFWKILFIVANGKILRSTPLPPSHKQTSSLGARFHNYLAQIHT